jgi:hypothetical protein
VAEVVGTETYGKRVVQVAVDSSTVARSILRGRVLHPRQAQPRRQRTPGPGIIPNVYAAVHPPDEALAVAERPMAAEGA